LTFIYRHLQGSPGQQRFTIRSGVLTGNDTLNVGQLFLVSGFFIVVIINDTIGFNTVLYTCHNAQLYTCYLLVVMYIV